MSNAYGISRVRRLSMTIDDVKQYLWDAIDQTNRCVYTSLVNFSTNAKTHDWIMAFIVVNGSPVNISWEISQILGLKSKFRITDVFKTNLMGEDIGRGTVKRLQKELYKGLQLGEELRHEWI